MLLPFSQGMASTLSRWGGHISSVCDNFLAAYSSAKIIQMKRVLPKSRSQMHRHLFYETQCYVCVCTCTRMIAIALCCRLSTFRCPSWRQRYEINHSYIMKWRISPSRWAINGPAATYAGCCKLLTITAEQQSLCNLNHIAALTQPWYRYINTQLSQSNRKKTNELLHARNSLREISAS